MDLNKWKEASEKFEVQGGVDLFKTYQKDHDNPVFVLGQPSTTVPNLILAIISSDIPEEEQRKEIEEAKQNGFVPIGFIGAPNARHTPTKALCCLTPVTWFAEVEGIQELLHDVAERLTSNENPDQSVD